MFGLLAALALHGAAAPAGVDVAWRSDGTCPEEQFRRGLDDLLAGAVAREPVRADVRVRQAAPGRWTVTLTLTRAGNRGTRRLEGSSCASVSEAAAFVTAVAVDPTVIDRAPAVPEPPATEEPPALPDAEPAEPPAAEAPLVPPVPVDGETSPPGSPPSEPAEEPAPPPATVTPVLPDPAPAPRPRRARPRGHVRLAGGLEAFGAPQVGAQVQLAAGLSGRTWRFELRGIYRAPTRADPWPDLPASARIGLWTVGALGCALLRPGPLEVPLCAGLEAGQTPGVGRGFAGARPDRLPWVAAVFGPALAWAPRPRFALWLGIEAAVPLTRGVFQIAGLGVAHETGPVSLRGALGFELRFP